MQFAVQQPLWTPAPEFAAASVMADYRRWLAQKRGLRFDDYESLWRWSVEHVADFWQSIWDYFDLHSTAPVTSVLGEALPGLPSRLRSKDSRLGRPGALTGLPSRLRSKDSPLGRPGALPGLPSRWRSKDSQLGRPGALMPGARWFEGARLNYAQQVFRHARADRPAIRYAGEDAPLAELSWAELERQVAGVAAALRAMGVGPGDRVAAYLPNIPQAVVAFLATASVGAIWSVCAPEMGPVAVLDRLRQIEPKVLFAVTAYRHGGRRHERGDTVRELLAALPSVQHWVLVPHGGEAVPAGVPPPQRWDELLRRPASLRIEALPFEHPLWVVYSSGTTGLPKPIVHGHGGIVVEHLKLLGLHCNLRAGDVFHWFSSSGWIMWNVQLGGLLAGATIALYDGSPGYPDYARLWRFADEAGVTSFGAGAAFFASCMKAGLEPARIADVSRLKMLGSTGSPLPPEAYTWIQRHVRSDLWINPIAGGTDFAGAFVGGNPMLPVYAGEMQCRCLGAKVEAFDEAGRSLVDQVGELVCTAPLPSMPLALWGDLDGQRLHESYFDVYPGVWRHGDWVRITPRGGAVIYGRSDATINRFGIRMGTSELYRIVEDEPEVLDSLAVDLEYLGRESWMTLFVVLREGCVLDDALVERMKARIRAGLSPHHVPNEIVQAPDVPRTLSGKKMEVPIKKLMLGQELAKVVNADAMANSSCLAWYRGFAERHLARAGEG